MLRNRQSRKSNLEPSNCAIRRRKSWSSILLTLAIAAAGLTASSRADDQEPEIEQHFTLSYTLPMTLETDWPTGITSASPLVFYQGLSIYNWPLDRTDVPEWYSSDPFDTTVYNLIYESAYPFPDPSYIMDTSGTSSTNFTFIWDPSDDSHTFYTDNLSGGFYTIASSPFDGAHELSIYATLEVGDDYAAEVDEFYGSVTLSGLKLTLSATVDPDLPSIPLENMHAEGNASLNSEEEFGEVGLRTDYVAVSRVSNVRTDLGFYIKGNIAGSYTRENGTNPDAFVKVAIGGDGSIFYPMPCPTCPAPLGFADGDIHGSRRYPTPAAGQFNTGNVLDVADGLSSSANGSTFNAGLEYDSGGLGSDDVGSGWRIAESLPVLHKSSAAPAVYLAAKGNYMYFTETISGGVTTYTPTFSGVQDKLTSGLNFINSKGDYAAYPAPSIGTPSRASSYTDRYGNTTSFSYSSGKLTSVSRGTETFTYTYYTSGSKTGLLKSIVLTHGTTFVRKVLYDYYTGSSGEFGNLGDLKEAATLDADLDFGDTGFSSHVIRIKYYRYYTPDDYLDGSGNLLGYPHGMKYVFDDDSYQRLVSAHGDPLTTTVTDSNVAPYASRHMMYDAGHALSLVENQGAGCSCSGSSGQGTYSYTREFNPGSTNDYNKWFTKVTENLPDGHQEIVYSNYAGGTMLSVDRIYSDPTDHTSSYTDYPHFTKFDSSGRISWTAEPSAFQLSSGKYFDDSYDDLLHFVSSNSAYLKDSDGLIHVYTYGSSTGGAISDTVAADVAGYPKEEFVQQGETGTPVKVLSKSYYKHTANSMDTFPLASTTIYRNTNGTGGETTSYSYTWYSSSQQMESRTTTKPLISTAQNGPNDAGDAFTEYFDQYGQAVWTVDAEGYITYTEYDNAKGGITKSVVDVDPTSISSPPVTAPTRSGSLPTALNLVTAYEVDELGRTTKTTDPRGNVTYTVYNDVNHEVRTYPGWDGTSATTGPTIVSREDRANNYRESLTMTATPSVSSSKPTGTESVSNIQSLSRQLLDNSGRVIYSDRYFDLTTGSPSYSTSSTALGTLNTNYYRTAMEYDERGRKNKSVDALGTITRTVYDGLGRVVSIWVGTDDTPTTGYFSPSNTSGTDLVKVSENQYDGGSMGDSTLTQVSAFLDSSGTNTRVNQMYYDWRDRPVATKAGVQVSESTAVHRPITYCDFDNLGQCTAVYRYDGDGVTVSTSSGVVSSPSSSYLRAKTEMAYDDQGRVYQTAVWSVDQSSGAVSSTNKLVSNTWFDHRGDVTKTSAPGGLVSKSVYDGAGRVTVSYVTDGGGDSAWSDASTVTGDKVLEQIETTYNANGAAILTVSKSRNYDESATGALADQSTTPKARVAYSAAYYDAADRLRASISYGTNGGNNVSAPSDSVAATIPTRSDTVLVTSYTYTPAGYPDEVTDPNAIVNKTYCDLLGRSTKTIESYTDGTPTNANNRITLYTYDALNHIRTLTADMPSGSNDQTTEYLYGVTTGSGSDFNNYGLLTTVKYPNKTTGAASTSNSDQNSFTYNALGEIKTKVDQNGTTHTYGRDILGRMTSDAVTLATSNPQNVDNSVLRREISFNTQGNIYQLTTYNAATSGSVVNQIQRAYNNFGQLITEYQEHSGSVNTSTSAKVQYAYTETTSGAVNNSRLTSMTYPNGRLLRYEYSSGLDSDISRLSFLADDSSGSVGIHLEEYGYLGLGSVIKRAHPEPGVDLTYIKQGMESNGDAGDQYAGIDRFGRIVDQRWIVTSGGSHTDRFQYAYDRDSNRLYKNNLVASAQSELYHANGSSAGYDSLNRLSDFERGTLSASGSVLDTVSSASHSIDWSLDALGNMASVTTDGGSAASRTHNSQNQITAVGGNAPTYDNNGSLTNDGTQSYIYDAWNMLVTVKNGAGTSTIVSYVYDAANRRIHENPTSGAASDQYYSSRWQVLEEKESGTAKRQYVWSPVYIDAMVLRDRDANATGGDGLQSLGLEERLYAEQDANFNLTSIVNTSGAVQERYLFDPYGTRSIFDSTYSSRSTSSFVWVYGHQGLKLDVEDALVYARNRSMNLGLARWNQQEPFGAAYVDGGNLYVSYSESPVSNLDWDGFATSGYSSDHHWFGGGDPGKNAIRDQVRADCDFDIDDFTTTYYGIGEHPRGGFVDRAWSLLWPFIWRVSQNPDGTINCCKLTSLTVAASQAVHAAAMKRNPQIGAFGTREWRRKPGIDKYHPRDTTWQFYTLPLKHCVCETENTILSILSILPYLFHTVNYAGGLGGRGGLPGLQTGLGSASGIDELPPAIGIALPGTEVGTSTLLDGGATVVEESPGVIGYVGNAAKALGRAMDKAAGLFFCFTCWQVDGSLDRRNRVGA